MKTRHCLFALLALAGCGPGREVEPNDHFTEATPVRGAGRVEGTLARADDQDWYRIELARPGDLLSARVGGVRGADFVLSVRDAERRELKRYDETATGGDEKALDIGSAAGPLYLVLTNRESSGTVTAQPYTLELSFEPGSGRESEPNDRALQATPLPPGGLLRGRYFPSRNLLDAEGDGGEEDWFRIDVPQEGQFLLNVDVSEVPRVDPVLEVYGPNAYKLREVTGEGPGRPVVLRGFGIRGPVHYFLRLRGKTRQAYNAEIHYQLMTELLPYRGAVEFEPNDQRLEATVFQGEAMEGSLTAGDADWYRVEVPEDGSRTLSASLGALEGADLVLSLADDLGRVVMTIDDQGRELPEVLTGLAARAGTHYLIVREKDGKAADPRRSYRLEARVVERQPGLELELNDSTATAQALAAGGSVDGYLAPKGDADFYVFRVDAAGEYALEVSALRAVRPGLTLYDENWAELVVGAAPKAGEHLALSRALEPGTYWLRLAAEPGQSNTRDKYTLRVRPR